MSQVLSDEQRPNKGLEERPLVRVVLLGLCPEPLELRLLIRCPDLANPSIGRRRARTFRVEHLPSIRLGMCYTIRRVGKILRSSDRTHQFTRTTSPFVRSWSITRTRVPLPAENSASV